MSRSFASVTLLVVLIMAFAVAAHSPVRAHGPVDTERTQIRLFVPYGPGGLSPQLTSADAVEGTCDSLSVADAGRPDAYRCMAGNAIYDPCFMEAMGDGTQLACAESPTDTAVTPFTSDTALDFPDSAPDFTALPWALELDNGKICTLLGGATFGLAGMRANYGCAYGSTVFGEPERSDALWRVFYSADDDAYTLDQVGVAVAWY